MYPFTSSCVVAVVMTAGTIIVVVPTTGEILLSRYSRPVESKNLLIIKQAFHLFHYL